MNSPNKSTLIDRAIELLVSQAYANLATCNLESVPWNSPVYAPWDEGLNFYWSSWREAVHSRNIESNPKVFLTLYDSTRARGTNNLRCLYVQAEAFVVSDELELASALQRVYPGESDIRLEQFLGDSVKRVYKAVPLRAWLNDKSEREVDPETIKMRIELPLPELKLACRKSAGRELGGRDV